MRSFPFTADVYFSLFETYNRAIWPAQIVAYVLGMALMLLALRPVAAGARVALAALAAFWLWNGIAYHLMSFLEINFAALGFAALFVLEGLLLAGSAIGSRRAFHFSSDLFGWAGLLGCLFAVAAYPLLAWLAGHGWPRAAMFGVAPAPTVVFTIGALLMLDGAPLYLSAIPLLWSLVGGAAAVFLLGIREDLSLLLAGVVGFALLVQRRRQRLTQHDPAWRR
jgi:hypothetical protein